MLQRRIELGERAPSILFLEKMSKRVSETDDGVEFSVNVLVQPAPVGVNRLHDETVIARIFECLGKHLGAAIDARHIETGLQKLNRVETGARRDIQNLVFPPFLQNIDEELPLAFRPALPIDQVIPFFDEGFDILLLIMVGFTHSERIIAKFLFGFLELFHGDGPLENGGKSQMRVPCRQKHKRSQPDTGRHPMRSVSIARIG